MLVSLGMRLHSALGDKEVADITRLAIARVVGEMEDMATGVPRNAAAAAAVELEHQRHVAASTEAFLQQQRASMHALEMRVRALRRRCTRPYKALAPLGPAPPGLPLNSEKQGVSEDPAKPGQAERVERNSVE